MFHRHISPFLLLVPPLKPWLSAGARGGLRGAGCFISIPCPVGLRGESLRFPRRVPAHLCVLVLFLLPPELSSIHLRKATSPRAFFLFSVSYSTHCKIDSHCPLQNGAEMGDFFLSESVRPEKGWVAKAQLEELSQTEHTWQDHRPSSSAALCPPFPPGKQQLDF